MPNTYFLNKNIALPGDILSIEGSCSSSSQFNSDNENVAIVTSSGGGGGGSGGTVYSVNVVGIGEAYINSFTGTCDNTGILLVSTEDGKQPFMTKKSFDEYTNYEMIFIFFTIIIIFILRLGKI